MGGSQRGGTAAGAVLGTPAAIPAASSQSQGWDLYTELLDAVCLLVTDPHPQVASCAAAVLRVADVELTVTPLPVSCERSARPFRAIGWHGIGCISLG